MPFTITKGRLDGVAFKKAASYSTATINPRAIILHDTAGRLNKFSSVNWFQSKSCTTSAHIVVETDGTVTQMVPLHNKAFHAGASSWCGKQYCNSFTIGIEIANPGALDKTGKAWFGQSWPLDQLTATPQAFKKSHGAALWLGYPPAQIKAVKELCRAIMEEYPDCNEVITHYLVSPGRKVDVNPLFPLEEVRRYAAGQEDVPDQPPSDKPATPSPPVLAAGPTEVVRPPANQPITAADLIPVSRQIGLLARWRNAVRTLFFGGGAISLTSLSDYTKGVYHDVSQFITDHRVVLGIVAVCVAWYILERATHYGVLAANEGRYVPSGHYEPHPILPGPADLDPQDSL